MQNVLEPALDSCAGNIEIALYMAQEIETELETLCRRRHALRDAAANGQQGSAKPTDHGHQPD
jgi:hypothetical protein